MSISLTDTAQEWLSNVFDVIVFMQHINMMLQLLHSVAPGETQLVSHKSRSVQMLIYNTHILKYKHFKKRHITLTKLCAGKKTWTHTCVIGISRWYFLELITIDSLSPYPKLNHQHYMLDLNPYHWTWKTEIQKYKHTQLYSLSLQLCYLCIQLLSTPL